MLFNCFLVFFIILNINFCSTEDSEYKLKFSTLLNYIQDLLGLTGDFYHEIDNSTIGVLLLQENSELIYLDFNNLHNLTIKRDEPFKVIVHGLRDRYYKQLYTNATREYRKKGNVNIMLFDWGDLANTSNANAPRIILGVGITLGNFIIKLNTTLGIAFEQFHLIGFSIGSHVAGFAGKHVKNMTGYSIGRISGADPASRKFNKSPSYSRLDKTDALFVDVIHTDRNFMGINYIAGHADFYPNDGKAAQPHCKSFFSFITNYFSLCSHVMAPRYFIESINSYEFVSTKCNEVSFFYFFKLSNYTAYLLGYCDENPKAIMGENCNTSTRGQYYLDVNKQPPYAKQN